MDTTLDRTERRRSRRLLGICGTTHAAHDGLSDMLYVLLPVLAEQFGLSLMQVGLVRGAHRAAMSLCQIPAGLVLLTLPITLALHPAIAWRATAA